MPPRKKSVNGLKMDKVAPEIGETETQVITDAVCNMKKSDWQRLSYMHAIDMLEEEKDP